MLLFLRLHAAEPRSAVMKQKSKQLWIIIVSLEQVRKYQLLAFKIIDSPLTFTAFSGLMNICLKMIQRFGGKNQGQCFFVCLFIFWCGVGN